MPPSMPIIPKGSRKKGSSANGSRPIISCMRLRCCRDIGGSLQAVRPHTHRAPQRQAGVFRCCSSIFFGFFFWGPTETR